MTSVCRGRRAGSMAVFVSGVRVRRRLFRWRSVEVVSVPVFKARRSGRSLGLRSRRTRVLAWQCWGVPAQRASASGMPESSVSLGRAGGNHTPRVSSCADGLPHNNRSEWTRGGIWALRGRRLGRAIPSRRYMAARNRGADNLRVLSVRTSSFSGRYFVWRHRVDDIGVSWPESRVDGSFRLRGQGSASTLSMEER